MQFFVQVCGLYVGVYGFSVYIVFCTGVLTLLFSGDGQYQEGEEDRLPPPDGPYYLADPAQLW